MAGRRTLRERLREMLNHDYQPGPLHQFLAAIPAPQVIVVTNYDTLVEQAFRAAGKLFSLRQVVNNCGGGTHHLQKGDSMRDEPAVMPEGRVRAFGISLIVLNLALVYVLVKIWPATLPPAHEGSVTLLWGTLPIHLWLETRYLVIVAVAGALGSYIHLATSFANYLGNRRLVWSWWYVLRPFIGTALALILYFAVRGGLIAGTGGTETLSPYGVAAIAGMAGMFSKQATDKLREVFEDLFKTTPPERADKLKESAEPTKATAEPSQPLKTSGSQFF